MRIPYNAWQFEITVADILTHYGFVAHLCDDNPIHKFDILAEYNHTTYAVELKFSRSYIIKRNYLLESVERHINRVQSEAGGYIPVLIVAGVIPDELKILITGKFQNIILCDIQNLLYMCESNENLKSQLVSLLDYSVDTLQPIKPDSRLEMQEATDCNTTSSVEKFLAELHSINPGKEDSTRYEEWCTSVLKHLFSTDLSLWKKQEISADNLFRFDLICKIKNNNNDEFWQMAEKYFNTKYIIFEFKNYTNKITQKEIFTTEKYLFETALRKIAIIISRQGNDDNAQKAISGILRENGKLIISISDMDVLDMLNGERQSPSEILSDKLDEFLMCLDK